MLRPFFGKRASKRLVKYFFVLIVACVGAYTVTGDSRVVDGDTLKIGKERIRLEGIDAPETTQSCVCEGKKVKCGEQATRALTDFIGSDTVFCEGDKRDRYGRLTAECFIRRDGEKINLNRWMVAEGHAVAYRHFSKKFVPDEELAKADKKGLWNCSFELPWQYRKRIKGKKKSRR